MSDENDTNNDAMRVDTDMIRQLADMLSENDLSEIEVEDGDRRIVVKRKITVTGSPAAPAPAAVATPAQAVAAPNQGAEAPAVSSDAVRSPMVGTAFLSPEPGAAPFVAAGQQVKAGDTLLIIEAMKVMNPITAPKSGTVSHIYVADAQPVEFDQALVLID